MNTKHTCTYSLLAAAIISCLQSGESNAAVQYNISDLGTIGGSYSLGFGINELDAVTGLSHGVDNAINQTFLSAPNGIAQPIGVLLGGAYSQGMDINNFHDIVGQASLPGNVDYHAFFWQNTQATDLGTLDQINGTGTSLATGINDNRLVTGFSDLNGGSSVHAVVWNQNTGTWQINDIGTLDQVAGTGNSKANGINELGQVTGLSTVPGISKAQHAVVWTSNGTSWTPLDLGTLGGSYSAGFAINNSGEVTGSSTISQDAQHHAFIAQSMQNPPTMTDLKTLGGSFSEGYSINLAGDVVGYSTTLGDRQQVAFLWQNGIGMQDLNTLIDPASGWILLEARSISDKGNITGVGLLNGEKHAFLLTSLVSDTTPPLVSYQITPASPNPLGWYQASPSITWSVTDPESAVSSKIGCTDVPAVANTTISGITYSCTATSAGGTSNPVSTPIIKVDTTSPVLTGIPASLAVQATSLTGAVVTYTLPTASDVSSGINSAGVSCVPAAGSSLPMGASTVNCSVQDNAGNSVSASFTVTVADLIPPTFTSCPATVALVEGNVLPIPLATDNLSTPVVTGAPASLPMGTTQVSWTATDQAGLTAMCIQDVTVTSATVTPPPVNESISVSRAECKRISATAGEWLIQGTTSIASNNSIAIFSTSVVPSGPSSTRLGTAVPDSKGQWQFQAKPGQACTNPISLQSAFGTNLNGAGVAVK